MKKLLKVVSCFVSVIILMICLSCNIPLKSASASSGISNVNFDNSINAFLNSYVEFDERVAGSEDEKNAGDYIISVLNQTECEPFENENISNGIQSFRFQSIYNGAYLLSRNIIYTYKSSKNTTKKVIIGCSYDAVAYKYNEYGTIEGLVATEGVNGSAGSVALLLTLAKYLPKNDYDFDIQFIFFGAGSSDNAGAKYYTQGILEEDSKDILLMINLDNISVGQNLYFYVDEIENDFSKYVSNHISENSLNLRKVSTSNLGKIILTTPNKLGLSYSHIALTSSNIYFMKNKILTMNIFSGDYSSNITLGRCEYDGKEVVTYTANDNISYIKETYGESSINENLYSVYESIESLLLDDKFETVCVSSQGQNSWFYVVFGNAKLPAYLTMVLTIVLICVALVIHFNLTKRAYYSNIEKGFIRTVLDITANISGKIEDEEIPKFISEIIVKDIKKDKRLKGKK